MSKMYVNKPGQQVTSRPRNELEREEEEEEEKLEEILLLLLLLWIQVVD